MTELLLCECARPAAPSEQVHFIVEGVAPLVRTVEFERLSHGHFISRYVGNLEAHEVWLRVFVAGSDEATLRSLIDSHLECSMRFKTPIRDDPMLAPELEWYRRALTMVTTVAVEVLETSNFRLSSALLSEKDIFTRVGRTIVSRILNKYSTTYQSLTSDERTLFWSELSTNSCHPILPCRPGHWLWNLLAF